MRNWNLIGIAVLILAGLVYLVYLPLLRPAAPSPISHLTDAPPVRPAPTVLTFGSDSWPPYAGVSGGEQEGYIVEVLREVYEPLGYEVRYVNQPWTRCIEQVRSGEMTGLAGCDVHEAPDLLFPRHAIGVTEPTFYVPEGSTWWYTGIGSLLEVRLGAIRGYTYQRDIDVYIRQHRYSGRVLLAGGDAALAQLMRMLKAGRIDAFIESRPVVRATIKTSPGWRDLREAGGLEGLQLFVAFSDRIPETESYARIFDRRIVELRHNGRLAEILAGYDVEDWEPGSPMEREP